MRGLIAQQVFIWSAGPIVFGLCILLGFSKSLVAYQLNANIYINK